MNKKVMVSLGVLAGLLMIVLVAGIIVSKTLLNDEPVNNNDVVEQPTYIEYDTPDKEEYVGKPLPNIITKSGTIKKVGKNKVYINGADDELITIYITKDTKIFGADGMDRDISDLEKGMYITVDIDGDEIEEDYEMDKFYAMTIYVSGK